MSNNAISAAQSGFRKTIMDEVRDALLRRPDHTLLFPEKPIHFPASEETVVQIRYQQGRILVGLDTDMEVEEEDFEMYSIDEMLAIAEKVFQ